VNQVKRLQLAEHVPVVLDENGKVQRKPRSGPEKGHARWGGRTKGTANKTNKQMRDLILEAAADVGEDGEGKDGVLGFLRDCARHERVAYLNALVKLVPHQLVARVNTTLTVEHVQYETIEEAREALEKEGIIINQVLQ
jgi:hypothetical protein